MKKAVSPNQTWLSHQLFKHTTAFVVSTCKFLHFFSPPQPERVPHHAWMRPSTCCVCTCVQMIRHEDRLRLWAHHLFQPQFSKTINQSLIQDDTHMQIIFHPESTKAIMSCASACFQSSMCADVPPFAGNMSNKLNNCAADTRSGSQMWMRGLERKTKKNTPPTQTETEQRDSEGNGRITAAFTWF